MGGEGGPGDPVKRRLGSTGDPAQPQVASKSKAPKEVFRLWTQPYITWPLELPDSSNLIRRTGTGLLITLLPPPTKL